MAEAFVKTFKRDYVGSHRCPDAATVMRQLATWFEDYNENAPHMGLRMRSLGNSSAHCKRLGVRFCRGNSINLPT